MDSNRYRTSQLYVRCTTMSNNIYESTKWDFFLTNDEANDLYYKKRKKKLNRRSKYLKSLSLSPKKISKNNKTGDKL